MSNKNHNGHNNYNSYSKMSADKKAEEPVVKETELSPIVDPEVTENTNVPEVLDTPEEDAINVPMPEPEPEVEKTLKGVVSGCVKLNIRKAPKTTAPIVCTVNARTVLEIVNGEMVDGWYKVITETGAEGYCMVQYIIIK